MANIELAVYNLLETFYKYSGKEGDALKLNQKELTALLQQELPSIVQDAVLPSIDTNGDGEVDFEEFISFINENTTTKWDRYVRALLTGKRNTKLEVKTATEKAMAVLIKTFQKYAGREGNPLCLENRELRDLVRLEMPTIYKCFQSNRKGSADILRMLDTDGNGKVDFKEFMSFLAKFAVAVDMSVVHSVETKNS
ncbi:filaggrin-2-like [Acipenser oxyrinchus oxyrinchus]|uniref:Filaggrin-2-like n=1 Tax=Acipenser oxyrinchus oxyrinchus TaxID=40147 RepID=A0AAD8CVA3_ACIOX|nr:filaggrin-2-like [Acipenser oxyrinchus oxyrinchus]